MADNQFGREIRALRQQQGRTLRDVAQAVGIDFTYLSKIENGHEVSVSERTIRKIADEMELDPLDADALILASGKLPIWARDALLGMPPRGAATLLRATLTAPNDDALNP